MDMRLKRLSKENFSLRIKTGMENMGRLVCDGY